MTAPATEPAVESFIARWQAAGGSERANYQLFIGELCALLDLPRPDPARDDTRDNAYVFERRVTFHHGDGTTSHGFIDCYKRGAFVLEAKKIKAAPVGAKGFDDALQRARGQAEAYARACRRRRRPSTSRGWCRCSRPCTTNSTGRCWMPTAGATSPR